MFFIFKHKIFKDSIETTGQLNQNESHESHESISQLDKHNKEIKIDELPKKVTRAGTTFCGCPHYGIKEQIYILNRFIVISNINTRKLNNRYLSINELY
jgi:hypothetical protein